MTMQPVRDRDVATALVALARVVARPDQHNIHAMREMYPKTMARLQGIFDRTLRQELEDADPTNWPY